MKKSKPILMRQGDVMCIKTKIPKTAKPVDSSNPGKVILAFGEKTGHHHRFESSAVTMLKDGDVEYIRVEEPSDLVHEEHDGITFGAGDYRILHQREYHPQAIRRVTD